MYVPHFHLTIKTGIIANLAFFCTVLGVVFAFFSYKLHLSDLSEKVFNAYIYLEITALILGIYAWKYTIGKISALLSGILLVPILLMALLEYL